MASRIVDGFRMRRVGETLRRRVVRGGRKIRGLAGIVALGVSAKERGICHASPRPGGSEISGEENGREAEERREASEAAGPGGSLEGLSDAALVRRVRARSPEALGALYRRHGALVYHVAYRFLASEHDAQDVLQDVFAGLPEALRSYEERDRFEYWLKRLAVRASLMVLRIRERRRENALPERDVHPASGFDPEMVADIVTVRRALRRLTSEQRAVLVLKQLEGYTHAEIGGLLGISEGASAARLHRALRKLWELLE